jgi:diphosphomevalonate decarboxylase
MNEQDDKDNTANLDATAVSFANLALVKYFGKRSIPLNLPAASSISLTLEPLRTETKIVFSADLARDTVRLNGQPADKRFSDRVSGFLDIVRSLGETNMRVAVDTKNSFPTAAGLASSASGFAALALAATSALGFELSERELSVLARRGSGSAARSIPGGICIWHRGEKADGSDSFAESIASPDALDLRVVVGVTDPGPKEIGSTQAMEQTRETSPYYDPWLQSVDVDIKEALKAVETRDLEKLGVVAERNALAMHAAALAARPAILFWKGPTVEGIHLVRRLRKKGIVAYFTCDAGPQPKILTDSKNLHEVAGALEAIPGVTDVIECRLGGKAMLV